MAARTAILAALVPLLTCACSGGGSATGPAGDPDAVDGPDLLAADGDVIEGPACVAGGPVEAVAGTWDAEVAERLGAEGLVPVDYASHDEVAVTSAQRAELRVARTAPPVYLDDEEAVLALPDDDPIREAWEAGDLRVPDWETEGLLVYWDLAPYTDNRLFADGERLVLATLRLEACLESGEPADPPREYVHRLARPVPRAAAVEHRTETRWYRLPTFPVDPAFERHPANPLVDRAGGNGVVVEGVEGEDGWHMWLNGYSGATGFILHATSDDGVTWDLTWDNAHTCSFEEVDLFRHKRDPAVIREDGGYTMWFTMEGATPTALTRLYRATSEDGLTWSKPFAVGGAAGLLRSPWVVVHEGTWHLFGHHLETRSISHATSDDGLHWSEPETILTPGTSPDAFDGACAFQPAAVHDGERWLLVYTACYAPREATNAWGQSVWYQMHVALATSTDGVTWERSERLLLSQTRTEGHWESGNVGRPVLLLRGGDAWLYYTGVEGGEPSVGLAIAESWTP